MLLVVLASHLKVQMVWIGDWLGGHLKFSRRISACTLLLSTFVLGKDRDLVALVVMMAVVVVVLEEQLVLVALVVMMSVVVVICNLYAMGGIWH